MSGGTVLITGSSRGLGEALVNKFAGSGWNVAATMLDIHELTSFDETDLIAKVKLDVTDVAGIDTAVAAVIARFGKIDLLINNAGYGSFSPVEAAPETMIRRLYDTNALGPVFVTRAVIPHMRRQSRGMIAFVTSIMGHVSAPMHALYGGCKWATDGFAESLVYEMASCGVQVKVMAPGAMDSTYFAHTDDRLDGLPAEYTSGIVGMKSGLEQAMIGAPVPKQVAEEIYAAVTDGTDQFRYYVTDQSRFVIDHRRQVGDEAWLKGAVTAYLQNKSVVQR